MLHANVNNASRRLILYLMDCVFTFSPGPREICFSAHLKLLALNVCTIALTKKHCKRLQKILLGDCRLEICEPLTMLHYMTQ